MPLPPSSDVDFMLRDTGVPVNVDGVDTYGILERPQQLIQDGLVITTEWTLLGTAEDFGDLLYGSGIIVDGSTFLVRESRVLSDGSLCELSLEKIGEVLREKPDVVLDAHGPLDPSPDEDDWFDGGSVLGDTYGDDREAGSP